jgi:hypothetical protein
MWTNVAPMLQLSCARTRFRNTRPWASTPGGHQQVHADRMVSMKEGGRAFCMILMTEQDDMKEYTATTSHREGHASAAEQSVHLASPCHIAMVRCS